MTHHLANAFSKIGVPTRVLAPTGPEDVSGEYPRNYSLTIDVNAKTAHRAGKNWTKSEAPRLNRFLKDHFEQHPFSRAVLIHPFYYGPALLEFCRARNIPISVCFLGFELRSQLLVKNRINSLLMAFKKQGPTLSDQTIDLARNADELLPISNYTAGLVKKTKTRRPIRVIGCGLDIDEYHRQASRAPLGRNDAKFLERRQHSLPEDKVIIGTVCRLVESKNVSMLVRAIQLREDFHGLIVGNGPELQALRSLSEELGIHKRITWIQNSSEDEKWSLLKTMDYFCLLSKELAGGQVEGFGIALLEATAAGVVTIACDSGGMVDIVKNRESGFVVPVDDITAIRSAIEETEQTEGFYEFLVNNARVQIEDKFNWTSICRNLVSHWRLSTNDTLNN